MLDIKFRKRQQGLGTSTMKTKAAKISRCLDQLVLTPFFTPLKCLVNILMFLEGWDGGGSRTSPKAWFLVIETLWADVNMMAHIHLRKKSNTDHSTVLSKQNLIEVNFTCHQTFLLWRVGVLYFIFAARNLPLDLATLQSLTSHRHFQFHNKLDQQFSFFVTIQTSVVIC